MPGSDRYVGLEGGGLATQAGTDLEAAREVLLGDEESMTYVPTRAMSEQAADVAVALLAGTPPAARGPTPRRSTASTRGSTSSRTSRSTP